MADLNDLDPPGDLSCVRCGDPIERGYVPLTDDDVHADAAVCDVCGWRDVGNTGCAPIIGDFEDGSALVRLETEGGTLRAVTITDRRE